jgi:hypothetical protein
MTDATYCLKETEKERKSLARMSRYKKSGKRTGYVRLPQTYMTEKEWKKMNGAVASISPSKKYSKAEFVALPDSLKAEYIKALIERYNPRMSDVANMLGLSYGGLSNMLSRLFEKNPFKNRGKSAKPTKEWLDFISPPPEVIVSSPENTQKEEFVEKKEEKPVPKANEFYANVERLELRLVGKPPIAFNKAMLLLEPNTEYIVNIEVYKKGEQ